MCGIAGISAVPGASGAELPAALARMLTALRHRGPDDEGSEVVARNPSGVATCALGNTRLAILDPSPAGHQPMHDPVTGNWAVLNGAIYNHPDLRRELGADTRWHSTTDTETLLRAYARWGPACVERLRGMFAVAIWDHERGRLWCARDRLGIKPFYFWSRGGHFVFASEVRALRASGLVPDRLDPAGLAGFVRFGSVPEPLTLVEGVVSLAPGHTVCVRAAEAERPEPYWRPGSRAAASDGDAAQALRGHLARAVREHLLADVPVASFLSGGADSALVTALAAQELGRRLRTFTVGFGAMGARAGAPDESDHAQAVAARFGTEHHRVTLADGEAAALIPAAVRAMDLPSADGLNTYVVSRAAAQAGARVALSGLGGDELFGGYRAFRLLPRALALEPVIGVLAGVAGHVGLVPSGAAGRAAEMTARGRPLGARYESLRALWSQAELRRMGTLPGVGYAAFDPGPTSSLAARLSSLELTGYMRSTLLRDGDAMSMAHGLELRLPFLDHELVDYCLATGTAARASSEGAKERLLRAAADLLPPGIASRPKQGFALPMDRWLRGSLREFATSGLERLRTARLFPGLDVSVLEQRFRNGRLEWTRLWPFAVLGHWLDARSSGP